MSISSMSFSRPSLSRTSAAIDRASPSRIFPLLLFRNSRASRIFFLCFLTESEERRDPMGFDGSLEVFEVLDTQLLVQDFCLFSAPFP